MISAENCLVVLAKASISCSSIYLAFPTSQKKAAYKSQIVPLYLGVGTHNQKFSIFNFFTKLHGLVGSKGHSPAIYQRPCHIYTRRELPTF